MKTFVSTIIFLFFGIAIFISCAQRGSPSGGPRDKTPPKFLGSTPDTLSTNVPTDIDEITIDFDEFLILKEYNKQIIISPPLDEFPNFKPIGSPKKYIRIEFKEELEENTTYNINFGNSVQDFNENNPLPNFKFVFSTGDAIDSLKVMGKVTNTLVKKLPENIVVALYKVDSAYTDSLLYDGKPYYISKLDSTNQYNLDYLHKGKYQLVAINDDIPNLKLEPEQELVGFLNEPFELDTLDANFDLTLFPPELDYRAIEARQTGYGSLVFNFRGKPDSVEITPIDVEITTAKINFEPKTDSLQFWFNPKVDSLTDKKSTALKFQVKYKQQIDTLRAQYKVSEATSVTLSTPIKSFAPNKKFALKSSTPIERVNADSIKVIRDSTELEFNVLKNNLDEAKIELDFPLNFKQAYKVVLLPGAIKDFFGETNDTLSYNIRVKDEKQFGNLKLKLENTPKSKFWLELFNKQDVLQNKFYGNQSEFEYKNLDPGDYYFRILVDENENGFWDTGNFFQRRQPEKVYILNGMITIRAYWDTEETWVLPSG